MIIRLIDPSLSDMAVLECGKFLNSVLKKMSGILGSQMIGEILKQVLVRLCKAQMPSLIQSFVMLFARLAQNNTNDIVNFLSSFYVPVSANLPIAVSDQSNPPIQISGLHQLLAAWTKYHEEFKGLFYLKMSIVGLCSIFQCSHPELNKINLIGDIIVDTNEGIVTRSKAKAQQKKQKYTILPLRSKIMQVLAREYQAMNEQANPNEKNENEDDDEDDMNELIKTLTGGLQKSDFIDSSVLGLDQDDEDEDDENNQDPDIINDPIFKLDLQATFPNNQTFFLLSTQSKKKK